MKIAIADYGVGNLFSAIKAFKYFLGENHIIATEEPADIASADALILPGVGSFESGIKGIEIRGLSKAIKEHAENKKPMLGICLGAQLMFTEGHEFGVFKGLDIIKGKVVKFPELEKSVKIPHMGWNQIVQIKETSWQGTILENIPEKSEMYFVHSYIFEPESQENVLAISEHGKFKFCSVFKINNAYGCQFHPEKSGEKGLAIIKNFLNQI